MRFFADPTPLPEYIISQTSYLRQHMLSNFGWKLYIVGELLNYLGVKINEENKSS